VLLFVNFNIRQLLQMSKVELREKYAASTVAADSNVAASVDTPPVIRELKNYHPFSGAQSFRLSRIRRDSFVAEHRSIGVFTSGGDASGIVSTALFSVLTLEKYLIIS